MPLQTELLEAIAGPNPAGTSIRYEPVFDQIKLARIEEADVPQGEWVRERKTADYALVVRLAREVLAKKSKDLQVAAWLTEALTYREGFSGLHAGLELIVRLLEQYWEGLYPEVEDGDASMRAAPLEWIGQYLDPAIRRIPLNEDGHGLIDYRASRTVPTEAEAKESSEKADARQQALSSGKLSPEAWDAGFAASRKAWYREQAAELDASLESLESLDALCAERFGEDDAPSFTRLRTALQEVRQVLGQLLTAKLQADPDSAAESAPAPEPPASVDLPVDVAVAVSPSTAAPGAVHAEPIRTAELVTVAAAPDSTDSAAAQVAGIARFLRAQSPTNPAAYLMVRGFRWGELRARSGGLDPQSLPAPPTEVRTRMRALALAGEWAELLEAAEVLTSSALGRGWLDLQRYVVTACRALGPDYDAVAAAVLDALRALLHDVPELPELNLMDDLPTATPETLQWLRQEGVLPSTDGAPAPAARARGADALAQQHLKQGRPQQAIATLMAEAAQEESRRARFLRRTQAVRIMVDHGMERVAIPILREMLEQIDQLRLEEWEAGGVVAEPMGLLYRCLLAIDEDSSMRESLYLRICRLDPLQAIRFTTAEGANAFG
jgi:type VI secretion system protein ImpA